MRLDVRRKSKHQIALQKREKYWIRTEKKKSLFKVQHQPVSKLINQEKTVPNMEYSVHCDTETYDTIQVVCPRSHQTAPGGKALSNSLGKSHLRWLISIKLVSSNIICSFLQKQNYCKEGAGFRTSLPCNCFTANTQNNKKPKQILGKNASPRRQKMEHNAFHKSFPFWLDHFKMKSKHLECWPGKATQVCA